MLLIVRSPFICSSSVAGGCFSPALTGALQCQQGSTFLAHELYVGIKPLAPSAVPYCIKPQLSASCWYSLSFEVTSLEVKHVTPGQWFEPLSHHQYTWNDPWYPLCSSEKRLSCCALWMGGVKFSSWSHWLKVFFLIIIHVCMHDTNHGKGLPCDPSTYSSCFRVALNACVPLWNNHMSQFIKFPFVSAAHKEYSLHWASLWVEGPTQLQPGQHVLWPLQMSGEKKDFHQSHQTWAKWASPAQLCAHLL